MSNKLTYGVGYNSKGVFKTKTGNKKTDAYKAWHCAMQRCYESKSRERLPTYIGCCIDERWHDFQDFAKWYYAQEFCGMSYHLDKDLLVSSNKIYSPETCCLVPREINAFLTNSAASRGLLPQGVDFNKQRGMYRARLLIKNKSMHLGFFDCPNRAYLCYKAAKESHAKEKALEWQGRIAENVFQALMNWTLGDSTKPC